MFFFTRHSVNRQALTFKVINVYKIWVKRRFKNTKSGARIVWKKNTFKSVDNFQLRRRDQLEIDNGIWSLSLSTLCPWLSGRLNGRHAENLFTDAFVAPSVAFESFATNADDVDSRNQTNLQFEWQLGPDTFGDPTAQRVSIQRVFWKTKTNVENDSFWSSSPDYIIIITDAHPVLRENNRVACLIYNFDFMSLWFATGSSRSIFYFFFLKTRLFLSQTK